MTEVSDLAQRALANIEKMSNIEFQDRLAAARQNPISIAIRELNSMKTYPVVGRTYDLRTILTGLQLRDQPSLGFIHEGANCVIQHSHVLDEHLLSLPLWADSQWVYIRETHEWIPVFRYTGDPLLLQEMLTIEPLRDPFPQPNNLFWCVPKEAYRGQYWTYVPAKGSEPAHLLGALDERYPVPVKENFNFCALCGDRVHLVDQQWKSVGKTNLAQYCWVDPSTGSQLHSVHYGG